MTIQTATRNVPTYKPMTASSQHQPADPTESYRSGDNTDRALVLGGAAVTLGTVALACLGGGHPAAALGGGALAAATGMAVGLPLASAGHTSTSEAIGLYVVSSLSSLSVGVAAGAILGGTGCGLLAATGAGAAAALAGNLVGRHL